MNLERFASQLRAWGICLSVTPNGGLRASGNEAAIQMSLPDLTAHKARIIAALESGLMRGDLIHRHWKVTYPNRDSDCTTSPAIDAEELLAWHPGAVGAEICTPQPVNPSKPLTDLEVQALTQWLQRGGETDLGSIDRLIEQCTRDRIQKKVWLDWMNDLHYQCKGFTANES